MKRINLVFLSVIIFKPPNNLNINIVKPKLNSNLSRKFNVSKTRPKVKRGRKAQIKQKIMNTSKHHRVGSRNIKSMSKRKIK